jgi:L-histidine Nalpha-methyltransferase
MSVAVDAKQAMRDEVVEGLSRGQKELSPKYFYDRRGSELFEEITRLPAYYPTRTERRLLREHIPNWLAAHPPRTLVELGAGAADKTRAILDAMREVIEGRVYVPVDISGEFLDSVAAALREEYPRTEIRPFVADMAGPLDLPGDLPEPVLFALLGSTIGNFLDDDAAALLRRVRERMAPEDRFLLGFDLIKDVAILEAAYDDPAGVTAAFNLNVLAVLNRELGADFDPDDFRHRAFFDSGERRIEMHLVAKRPLTVIVPGAGAFAFAAGESVRTEVSCKYDRARVDALFATSGLMVERWAEAEPGFALVLACARST